jgi:hypothetical protein
VGWLRLIRDRLNALKELDSDFDLEILQFGSRVDSILFDFKDQETNFSNLFQYIQTKYYNRNIGALIMASDGIYTRGESSVFAARDANFQIFTLALGDTLLMQDILIKQVDFNKVVYKGSVFPVFVNVDAFDMQGQLAELQLIKNGKVIQKQKLAVDAKYFFKKVAFKIPADSVGLHSYTLKIDSDITTENKANNQKKITVEVSDETKNILLLFEGYHPDIAVFNRAISSNPVYKLDIKSLGSKPDSLQKYALVILYQLPSVSSNLNELYSQFVKYNIPVFYVLGEKTFVNAFNTQNNLYQITQSKNFINDALPELNPGFSLFNLNFTSELIQTLHPLQVPFGDYQEIPASQVLFNQKIGNVLTQRPMLCFMESGDSKTAFLFGEGIWQWSMQEYRHLQNHSFTNELITKSIQYLTQAKQKKWIDLELPVNHPQHIPLTVKARLYNASNEIITEPELHFDLIDASNNSYPLTFQQGNNSYTLDVGILQEGTYRYQIKTTFGDSVYTKIGRFFVDKSTIEKNDLQARHQELFNLAKSHGGNMVFPHQLTTLINDINTKSSFKSTYIENKSYQELLNLKIIFTFLLIFIVLDWLLRKLWGSI